MPPRILFVTPYVPSRLRTRPHGFLRTLAKRGHRLALVTAASSAREESDAAALAPWCEKVTVVRVSPARSLLNCALGSVGSVPFQALYTHSPALAAAVRDELGRGGYDLLHVEHLRAARLALEVGGVARVFDSVDCITDLFEHAARDAPSRPSRWRARLDLERTRLYEGWLWRQFDAALVTTAADREALLRLPAVPRSGDDEHLAVVPNGVELDYFSPASEPRRDDEIVFVGRMGYHANVAAAVRLVEEIMPAVWAARPEMNVTIVGAEPAATVEALGRRDARVTVTGAVPDVRPYLRRATLAACPLVYAAGIQNKVLEAMACGTPVVTSTDVARGLALKAADAVLQADDNAAFSHQILLLLDDAERRRRLGDAGRAQVAAAHDWNLVVARLEELYQGALARFRARGQG